MSLETWKAEFYPIDASKVPVEDAVQHSLRKWRGLTKENLASHELSRNRRSIEEGGYGGSLPINSESCALCHHYFNGNVQDSCDGCPLFESLGRICYEGCEEDNRDSIYHQFTINGNPLPMIAALEKAAALEPEIR